MQFNFFRFFDTLHRHVELFVSVVVVETLLQVSVVSTKKLLQCRCEILYHAFWNYKAPVFAVFSKTNPDKLCRPELNHAAMR